MAIDSEKFPKVLISLLNWNAANNTIAAIHSVLSSSYSNYTLLIIDNNSIDDSVNLIQNTFPGLKLLKLSNNLGYAGAHKKAADMAIQNKYDLLWILNNDIIVYPETLSALVEAYKRNGEAILSSVSLNEDEKTIHFGGGAELDERYKHIEKYNHFAGEIFSNSGMTERAVSDVEGASWILPVSLIRKAGFLDTRYFLFGEETDYCYNVRKKYGIPSIMVPSSVIIHKASQSFVSPKMQYIKAYYFTRNIHLLYKKHFKEYKIKGQGGLLHLIKYFFKHYTLNNNKADEKYWLGYYTKLGYLHALLRVKGKYIEPNNYYK